MSSTLPLDGVREVSHCMYENTSADGEKVTVEYYYCTNTLSPVTRQEMIAEKVFKLQTTSAETKRVTVQL